MEPIRRRKHVLSDDETVSAKKVKVLKEQQSPRERAAEYRLCSARMPVDALTSVWKHGCNRPVNPHQVEKLVSLFTCGSLNRNGAENRLLVLCSAADVQAMQQHLGTRYAAHGNIEDEPLSFLDWPQVHGEKLVEVMAGQHRIEALRKVFRQDSSGGVGELWWTCEFYDLGKDSVSISPYSSRAKTLFIDRLPPDLDRELRMNRQDLTMADNHGQVWNQARSAIAQDPTLLEGNFKKVTEQVTRALYLGAVRSAPVRRLVTIWRNERWRSLANAWCETRLGVESFSISTWSWMITCRLHDVSIRFLLTASILFFPRS